MRILFNSPIWLFRMHLGWLLGDRFLLLTHTGRKSGLPRQTFVEVLKHDKVADVYYVLSGRGEIADWLRNVEKTPKVMIKVGHRQFNAMAVSLEPEEAERTILDYAQHNPLAIRVIPRLMGYQLDGSDEDFRALAHLGIVVAFHAISEDNPGGK